MTLPTPHRVTGPAATAEIYDQGAHLTSWVPAGQQPVLWLSAATALEPGTAIRGGVPICFPWFGPGRTGDRKPSHGPARITDWRLVDQGEGRVAYEVTGAELGVQDLMARYDVEAGAQLVLTLTVTNTGTEDLTYEEALHSYLAVGDVRQVSVDGLDGAGYVDKTDQGRSLRQEGTVTLQRETDRVYRSAGAVTVADPVLGRRLRVVKSGSASTVVWNPWSQKSAEMADMTDDGWETMLCVEAGNVGPDEITLAPGDHHTLRCTIEVQAL